MFKKICLSFVICLILVISIFANDDFVNNKIVEAHNFDESKITVYSIYNPDFHEIKVILMYDSKTTISNDTLESCYERYMNKWIYKNRYGYKKYDPIIRKRFFNKGYYDRRFVNTYEVYTILSK
jgi:hypothetical protein